MYVRRCTLSFRLAFDGWRVRTHACLSFVILRRAGAHEIAALANMMRNRINIVRRDEDGTTTITTQAPDNTAPNCERPGFYVVYVRHGTAWTEFSDPSTHNHYNALVVGASLMPLSKSLRNVMWCDVDSCDVVCFAMSCDAMWCKSHVIPIFGDAGDISKIADATEISVDGDGTCLVRSSHTLHEAIGRLSIPP